MATKRLHTITFEGNEYKYNPKALKSYSIIKGISNPNDAVNFFKAFEAIFEGRDVEYAQMLDDDLTKMGELVGAICEEVGAETKN